MMLAILYQICIISIGRWNGQMMTLLVDVGFSQARMVGLENF